MSSSGLGLTQSPSQCELGSYFLTVKCVLVEADHSPSSCADAKLSRAVPRSICLHDVNRDKFSFYLHP